MSQVKPENVTPKHNKDVIFTALQEALATINSIKSSQHNPAADAQAKRNAATLESAKAIQELSISEVVAKLKGNISTILNDVTSGIEQKIEELTVIDNAIALKKAELKEVHGIEAEANTFAALVNAHAATRRKLEDEQDEKRQDYASELDGLRTQVKTLREELAQTEKEWKADFETTKKRARAEWEYDFGREQQLDRDELNDELDQLRKQHQEVVAADTKRLDEREAKVEAREQAADHDEKRVAELQAKVDAIPGNLAYAEKTAFEKGQKDAEKVTAIRIAAKENELALKESALTAKNESLVAQLEAANKKTAELQEKLDAAYKDIRQMGIEMVSGKHAEAAAAKLTQGNNTGKQ